MMFLNPSQLFFMITLIMGTFISVSSSSWFTAWLGLELNLLSFIPLISSKANKYSTEAALKYFLIQALGSCIILMSAPASLLSIKAPQVFICASLLLKSGAAPVHFWFPSVMEGLQWTKCIILMTVQKIAPMMLIIMSMSHFVSNIIMISSILSSLAGAIGGLNQSLLRKIMAYSSINHMSWMLAAIYLNESMWITYFSVYTIISSSVILLFYSNQIYHFNHLSSFNLNNSPLKLATFLSLLSLGGLPPFLGFIPKWLIIQELIYLNSFIWLMFLLTSALITLFYYLRVIIVAMTLSSPKMKNSINSLTPSSLMAIIFINLFPLISSASIIFM